MSATDATHAEHAAGGVVGAFLEEAPGPVQEPDAHRRRDGEVDRAGEAEEVRGDGHGEEAGRAPDDALARRFVADHFAYHASPAFLALLVAIAFIDPVEVVYWLEFFAVAVIVLSFKLVVELGEELSDPFENQMNDTPMTAICRTIEIDLRQMLGEKDLPEPLEPENGILM